ncbi:POTRA domain-containing protein [Fibrobacter sp.]|uniref:BamA/OMP85 family outer membrane protein n=1 Tax=Fibrobacter sp. TaxID=35828 RepID=UPI0025BC8665|nr:POTRA domain-containing protein [Fibrobacter sp.]
MIFLILAIVSVTRAQLLEVSDSFMAENKVRKVMVDGTENMDERSVLGRVNIRDGQTYSPTALSEKIQASVLSLYNSGLFDDVTAWIDYVDDGTDVDVIFKIKELPALDTAYFDGCDEISEEDLRLKLRIIPGQVYSKSQLERDRQALLEYFHSEGYLLAEVGYRETPKGDNKNEVTFIVREGGKVRVTQFDIRGNDNVPAEDIKEHMLTKQDQWWGGGEFKQNVFEADRDTVLNAIRHFGYLDAELTDYRAEYLPDSSCLFYLGRMVPVGDRLVTLYDQLNAALADQTSPLYKMAGKPTMQVTHYYRQFHKSTEPWVSRQVKQIKDEEEAHKALNDIIRYETSRKEWLKITKGLKWNNPKIDSLLAIKKRSVYEEKLLVRYQMEDMFSALNKYDNIKTSSAIIIHISMIEGRRYYMGSLHFTGNEVLNDNILNYAYRLDSGAVFDQYVYDASKKALLDAYREDGYLFAQYTEERTFENDSTVNLTYHMVEGLPASIHKVHIHGNTKTNEKVIRREVRLYPGDTYRQSSLERSFREIMQLNYFDMVTPDIKVVGEQEVDLDFMVQEKEAGTGQFSLGVSYSESDGLVGTASISIPNCCMGNGQSASLNLEYGMDKKSAAINFQEPWFMDKPITVGAGLSYSWWDMSDYNDPNITRYGGNVYVGKRLKWPDDYFYGQIGYSWLMNKQGPNIDGSYVVYTGVESALNFRLVRDDKNLPQFPTDGSRYVLDIQWADDLLFSDFNFVKTELTVKWWFPLFRDRLAIALTNEYGVIFGDQLQYRTLYTMGGVLGYEGMMRGYSSGSIGYRRLGRSYQYVGAELQLGLVPQTFYLLPFFFDAGNVFGERYDPNTKVPKPKRNPLEEWDPTSLKKDIGFGFRVVVPMLGIIGFDFAWPLDVGETYNGLQRTNVGDMEFNFVIGQGF